MPDASYTAFNTRHHSHSYKRRSSRPPTRSPSPFMTSPSPQPQPQPAEPQAVRKRPLPARQASLGPQPQPNGNGHAATNGHATNGHALLSKIGEVHDDDDAARERASPPATKKIDWEIPRKTLHSSIGASAASAEHVLIRRRIQVSLFSRYTSPTIQSTKSYWASLSRSSTSPLLISSASTGPRSSAGTNPPSASSCGRAKRSVQGSPIRHNVY